MKPVFFSSKAEFRSWLAAHHDSADEIIVGYHKRHTGKPSLTWPESVDQALCYGWIDGVRRSLGPGSYSIRFTPRRPSSIWSRININRSRELIRLGLMRAAGRRAFEARDEERTRRYSFENGRVQLSLSHRKKFQANAKAWRYYLTRPPGYRKTTAWWVISAKKEETKLRRLETLIKESGAGRIIPPLRWGKTNT